VRLTIDASSQCAAETARLKLSELHEEFMRIAEMDAISESARQIISANLPNRSSALRDRVGDTVSSWSRATRHIQWKFILQFQLSPLTCRHAFIAMSSKNYSGSERCSEARSAHLAGRRHLRAALAPILLGDQGR